MEARATYEKGRDQRSREAASLEGRARVIATIRLALAVVALALIGGIVWTQLGAWGWGALGADVVAFVSLVFWHARVHDAKERALAALRFHRRGLARLDHAWDDLSATSEKVRHWLSTGPLHLKDRHVWSDDRSG